MNRVLSLLVCMLLGSGIVLGAYSIGCASAQADTPQAFLDAGVAAAGSAISVTPAVPDPIASPAESLSQLEALYRSGAFFAFGILVAFFGLTIASRKITWLQQDHRAVIVAAALGGLAILAIPASQGKTPNMPMVIGALITAFGLAMNPKKPEADAKKADPAAALKLS